MKKFKKISLLVLIFPLVVAGIFLSSCFCPVAEASLAHQPTIQTNYHCCCPDTLAPSNQQVVSEQAISQPSFNQKVITNLLALANGSFLIIEEPLTSNFKLSDFKLFQPQDIFLKSEILRI